MTTSIELYSGGVLVYGRGFAKDAVEWTVWVGGIEFTYKDEKGNPVKKTWSGEFLITETDS